MPDSGSKFNAIAGNIYDEIRGMFVDASEELDSLLNASREVIDRVVAETAEGETDMEHLLKHAEARLTQLAAIHLVNVEAVQQRATVEVLLAVLRGAVSVLVML